MKLKPWDCFFLFFLILMGAIASFFIYWPQQTRGNCVKVQVDGKITATYPLSEDRTETIKASSGFVNVFTIKDGTVSMTDANCSDKICVHTTNISKNGQTIVCLPHKVVLTIYNESGEEPEIDAITGRGGGIR